MTNPAAHAAGFATIGGENEKETSKLLIYFMAIVYPENIKRKRVEILSSHEVAKTRAHCERIRSVPSFLNRPAGTPQPPAGRFHPVTDRISSASRQILPGPRPDFIVAAATAARFYRQTFSAASAASMSARYFFTLTSFTTQVKTFIAICKSSQVGKEGAMRMLLSWGSLP